MKQNNLSPKAEAVYHAVITLFAEGADLNNLTVAEITTKAGIGKGTAYEYFTNKEEMIAGALYYEMQVSCIKLEKLLEQEKDIQAKIALLLQRMEEQMTETSCFFRVLHLMQDNSALSSTMQKLLKEKKQEEMLLTDLIHRMLAKEIGEDELGSQTTAKKEEFTYLVMSVYSQLICFGMYLNNKQTNTELSCDRMKELICLNISKAVNEFKA